MTNFSPPSQPLMGSDLHIWCAPLNAVSQDLPHYRSILSEDEVQRAKRFVFEKDRDHYIVGRGLLRSILGGYLNLEPAQLEFVYGQYGKPALKPGQSYKPLEFNLSHSKDLAVYAFNWDRQLGIDVEYVKPMPDMDDFAKQFYTPNETIFLNSLTGAQKESAFFKLWTCKEAFLKANGSGLRMPLNEVEISIENEKRAALSSINGNKSEAMKWHIEIFNPLSGYQAACLVEGNKGQFIFHQRS